MGSWLLDDIDDLLTTGGVTTTIYRGYMPPSPDEAVQIIETGGLAPIHAMSGGPGNAVVERPTFQVIRRSPAYARARAEMNVIWKLLDGHGDVTVNGTRYQWIEARQSPFPLGQDESGRWLLACNFLAAKALSTSTST